MDERSRVIIGTALGAAIGGLMAYLYMTESGNQMRAEIEPRLDDFVQEVRRMRGTVEKARQAAAEGWQSLSELVGGDEARPAGWQGGATRQASH